MGPLSKWGLHIDAARIQKGGGAGEGGGAVTPLELNRPFSVGIWPTPPFFWRMPNAAWRSHALSPPDASARGREDFFLARCDFVLKSVLLSHR